MNDFDVTGAFAGRLSRLERSNRRLRNSLVAVMLLIAVAATAAAGRPAGMTEAPEVVRAKAFVLVDANGVERARLHLNAMGSAALDLYSDSAGHKKDRGDVSIQAGDGNCVVALGTKYSVILAARTEEYRSKLVAKSEAEWKAAALKTDDAGDKALRELALATARDALRNMRLASVSVRYIETAEERDARFNKGLLDSVVLGSEYTNTEPVSMEIAMSSKDRIWLASEPDSAGHLKLSAERNVGSTLEMHDAEGKVRVSLGNSTLVARKNRATTSRPTSSLLFFDDNGTVVDVLPR